jgi:hypothetical protein
MFVVVAAAAAVVVVVVVVFVFSPPVLKPRKGTWHCIKILGSCVEN